MVFCEPVQIGTARCQSHLHMHWVNKIRMFSRPGVGRSFEHLDGVHNFNFQCACAGFVMEHWLKCFLRHVRWTSEWCLASSGMDFNPTSFAQAISEFHFAEKICLHRFGHARPPLLLWCSAAGLVVPLLRKTLALPGAARLKSRKLRIARCSKASRRG